MRGVFLVICWSERAQGCIHRAAGSANSFELSLVLHPQVSKLFVAFVNSSPLKERFVPVRADCCPGTGPNGSVFVGEWVLKHVFSFL